jgi:hypothetical protein
MGSGNEASLLDSEAGRTICGLNGEGVMLDACFAFDGADLWVSRWGRGRRRRECFRQLLVLEDARARRRRRESGWHSLEGLRFFLGHIGGITRP